MAELVKATRPTWDERRAMRLPGVGDVSKRVNANSAGYSYSPTATMPMAPNTRFLPRAISALESAGGGPIEDPGTPAGRAALLRDIYSISAIDQVLNWGGAGAKDAEELMAIESDADFSEKVRALTGSRGGGNARQLSLYMLKQQYPEVYDRYVTSVLGDAEMEAARKGVEDQMDRTREHNK